MLSERRGDDLGGRQGLYRQKKLEQLGEERYMALQHRAYSIVKRSDAIAAFMTWCEWRPG
jgi:hypothetical protein